MRFLRTGWIRVALLAAIAVLVIAGGAYGLTRVVGSQQTQSQQTHPASATSATPWLAITTQTLPVNRVVISAAVPGGPAAAAGLGPGDVITAVNGHPINQPGDVTAAIANLHPGDSVEVLIERGGVPLRAAVTLAAQPPGYP
jgi:S1-C subfamily serine protease